MQCMLKVRSAIVVAGALGLALAFAPNSASAAPSTATANIAVSTTVTNSCTAANGTLAFPAYTGAQVTATGSFTITCTTANADYTVALNIGNGTGASFATRYMMNGTYKLGYNIYTTSGGGTVWGDGTGTTSTVTGTVTSTSAQTINVYGQIPASEAATSGSYTDTVVATVSY